MNRWAAGEPNPFAAADWNASWQRGTVTAEQWQTLRAKLREQVTAWREHVARRQTGDDISAAGALSSAAHTAYHLGAIRQLLAAIGENT